MVGVAEEEEEEEREEKEGGRVYRPSSAFASEELE